MPQEIEWGAFGEKSITFKNIAICSFPNSDAKISDCSSKLVNTTVFNNYWADNDCRKISDPTICALCFLQQYKFNYVEDKVKERCADADGIPPRDEDTCLLGFISYSSDFPYSSIYVLLFSTTPLLINNISLSLLKKKAIQLGNRII